jgi:hypothetical protein
MRAWLAALRDVLSGLLAFPSHRRSTPAAIEARYRGVRRCC